MTTQQQTRWEMYRNFVRQCESRKDSVTVPPAALEAICVTTKPLNKLSKDLKKFLFYKNIDWEHTHWAEGVFPDATERNITGERARLLHSLLGIVNEAGELMEWVANNPLDENSIELDKVNLVEELGDLLWYVTLGLDSIGVSLDALLDANEAKLRARYPEGHFTEGRALTRDRDGERTAMADSINSTA